MKKVVVGKLFLCILCACAIVMLDVVSVHWLCADKTDLRSIPVAAKDIAPRTEITTKNITFVEVPNAYLMDNACTNLEEVIGKYTDLQGKIPKGSPFYRSMLKKAEELPDHPVLQLKEGEAVFSATGDAAAFASLTAGLRVDIHSTINIDSQPVTGRLIEYARILSVKDHQGQDIESPDSTGTAYMIELAVNKEDLELLTLAEESGNLRFFASSSSYQDEDAHRCEDSAVYQYLKNLQIVDLSDEILIENP